MSGIFKNFERLLSASNFATKNHRFLIKYPFGKINPASYYWDPVARREGLQPGHSYDIFQLSLVANELARQNQSYADVLKDVSDHDKTFIYSDLYNELQINTRALNSYVTQLVSGLKSQVFDFPVNSCANIIYVFSFQDKPALEILKKFVFPTLLEKLQYASTQNLIDIVFGLNKIGYFEDKKLWTAVLDRLKNKTHTWEYQEVTNHGWSLDVYEHFQPGTSWIHKVLPNENYILYKHQIANQYYAKFSEYYTYFFNWFSNNVYYPVFQRESRIHQYFPDRTIDVEQNKLFSSLEEVAKKIPEAGNILKDLRLRANRQ